MRPGPAFRGPSAFRRSPDGDSAGRGLLVVLVPAPVACPDPQQRGPSHRLVPPRPADVPRRQPVALRAHRARASATGARPGRGIDRPARPRPSLGDGRRRCPPVFASRSRGTHHDGLPGRGLSIPHRPERPQGRLCHLMVDGTAGVLGAWDAPGTRVKGGSGDLRRGGGHRRGEGRQVHPSLVHGHPRPAQELRHHQGGTRRRHGAGHGVRRFLDHRLQRDRGVGHDRHARPAHFRDPALPPAGAVGGAHVLRHPGARRRAVRGRSALRAAAGARPGEGDGLRPLLPGAGARVLLLQGLRRHRGARPGRLLRPHHAGRRQRPAPRHGAGARADGHQDRVLAPRGRAVTARDRHALRRRAADGRQRHDLPHRS